MREFGIRMSLGANPGSILRGVLVSGVQVTGVGLGIGLVGAFAMVKADPRDPVTFVGVAILVMAVAVAACWVPARRASLVDPAVTLSIFSLKDEPEGRQ